MEQAIEIREIPNDYALTQLVLEFVRNNGFIIEAPANGTDYDCACER